MNENDMDRYFWRTGHRWSGDDRPELAPFGRSKITGRTVVLLAIAFIVTITGLVAMR